MFIKEISIKNFRSFKEIKNFSFSSNYTSFTGENNCGKSNILRALNLFFNDIIDDREFDAYEDMHLTTIMESGREQTTINITSTLDQVKDKRIIKSLEYLKREGKIQNFDNDNLVLSLNITKTNAKIVQYSDPITRRRTQSKEINYFFDSVFKRNVNFVYIPSIKDLNKFINKEISYELLKRIFNTWGRGRNPRAQDFKNRFENIKKSITEIISEANENITDILKEQSEQITKFLFTLPFRDITEFLSDLPISIHDNLTTSISKKGSGIHAITLFSLIRYLDKYKPTNKYSNSQFIWAIEEPETFLHPKAQIKLYKALIEYSNDTQIFVTTHNYNFLNTFDIKSNYLLEKEIFFEPDYDQTTYIKQDENTFWQPFVDILGSYKPSFIPPSDYSKIYFFCEGVIDIRYIKKALSYDEELKQFFDENIILMDGKGDEIKRRATESLKLYKLKTFALVDGDDKGVNYFNNLKDEGFVENESLFQIKKDGLENPTMEGLVAKKREEDFKTNMTEEAINYYYQPRMLSLFDNIPESPPVGWSKNSIKNKMCEFMENNGQEDDFYDIIELLHTIKEFVKENNDVQS